MKKDVSEHVAAARRILRGEKATPEEILNLSAALKKGNEFGYGRKLLGRALEDATIHTNPELKLRISQQYALCTYKDADLPVVARLDRALAILDQADLLVHTRNQETLGLAGAIWKRKWEVENQKTNLERSLSYYQRGYLMGVDGDNGYTAINTAFALDCLAALEMSEALDAGTVSETAKVRMNEATKIRQEIVAVLKTRLVAEPARGSQWWFLVTIGEACFGLRDFTGAQEWLMKAAALSEIEEWQYESSAKQFAQLALLQERLSGGNMDIIAEAWQTLNHFLGNNAAAIRTLDIGKFGLALSGGGFRASLFHIGMLARLAELDLLRHVEVISCVSGGSIIGAHYYLELRQLLESKPDGEIKQQDYMELVQRVQRDFLAGVQRNIRMRVAADWLCNVKMMMVPNYTRTQRVGELFEKEIFARVQGCSSDKPIWLNELFIRPKDAPPNFHPKYHNWKREAKVPMLILNATALNSGHNWQFTASWMGEPPLEIDQEIDSNNRLRRMYYYEAPEKYKQFRLGHAVAASACVPGLFEPLTLPDLYEDVTVRLVDGGVHDNQGTGSLKEQDCSVMLVSDASGQMEFQENPKSGMLGVPLRSNSILMARVREAQYRELDARKRSGLLQSVVFLHLKKDLESEPMDWIGSQDEPDEIWTTRRSHPLTTYGVNKKVQEQLSAVRTDLDSFADAEAFALMTSAYKMAGQQLQQHLPKHLLARRHGAEWSFLAVEGRVSIAEEDKFEKLLEAASSLALKVWKLSLPLKIVSWLVGIGAAALLVYALIMKWDDAIISVTFGGVALLGLGTVLGKVVGKTLSRIVMWRKTANEIALGLVMSVAGFLVARIHLLIFDKIYLKWGSVKNTINTASK